MATNHSAVCLHNNTMTKERATDLSAHHYGAAALSFPKLLTSLLGSTKRGNLSECGVIAAVLADPVHPNKLGCIFLADMLTLYLAKAQRYYRTNRSVTQQGSPRQRIGPMYQSSMLIPRMTCYGAAAVSVVALPESFGNTGLDPASRLPVTSSNGWDFIDMEHGKRKPGWISHKPGSILKMSVEIENVLPGIPQSLGLTYLKSYEHMGSAALSCHEGCRCQETTLDGHESHHRHSVSEMTEINLMGFGPGSALSMSSGNKTACEIQVEVLGSSNSGGHKFKVMQLAVITKVNISTFLQISK